MKTAILLALLAVALTLAAVAAAQTAPTPFDASPTAQRLDDYFEHPNGPQTFRALTGLGDPQIEAQYRQTWVDPKADADNVLRVRLFPAAKGQTYFNTDECRIDYPIQTLKARIASLGENHPYVLRWIALQSSVFAGCLYGASAPDVAELPKPLATRDRSLARLQTQDRAYQLASLAFYRGDIAGALAAFRRIARGASPHRAAAIYMVAAIRAGTHTRYAPNAQPLVSSAESVKEVLAILADPRLAAIHPITRELLGWIGATASDEVARTAQVRATLADLELPAAELAVDAESRTRYALARTDIDRLHYASLHGDPSWWLQGGPPPDYTASRAMMVAAGTDPMAAWLLFPASYFQGHPWALFDTDGPQGWRPLATYARTAAARGDDPVSFAWTRVARAISTTYDPTLWAQVEDEQVKAQGGDEPSLAALPFDFYHQVRLALSGASPPDPAGLDAAIAHLSAFPFKDSEVYVAARHDGLQYLMTVGRIAEARRWRDQVAAPPNVSSTNQYDDAGLLQILAEDEPHLVAALGTTSAGDALAMQNNLSIGELTRLARRADTPDLLRAKFARVAWARTYALSRPVDAGLDKLMRDLNPLMTKAWTSRPGRTVRPGDRRALLDVLRSPGVNVLIVDTDRDTEPPADSTGGDDQSPGVGGIDLYNHDDDNWWCSWKHARNTADLQDLLRSTFFGLYLDQADSKAADALRDRLRPVLAASFAFRSQDPAEVEALAGIACAPKLLTGRVLDWVRKPGLFETRQGQAEALALAVKTTRYGCYSDGPHGPYSQAAWTLLHQRFAATPWAIATKYWFNCPLGGKTCPAEPNP